MGKINGEKSDCCLRNLGNTCTFEREREREREKHTLTFFLPNLRIIHFHLIPLFLVNGWQITREKMVC